jgi:hypothetical protein
MLRFKNLFPIKPCEVKLNKMKEKRFTTVRSFWEELKRFLSSKL